MRLKIFFIACIFTTLNAHAQYPGGIGTGLTLWLKANSGTTLTGSNVSQWNDLSGANVTGNFTTATALGSSQNPPALVAAGINFNPQVSFINTIPNSLASVNTFAGNNLFNATNNTILQVINVHSFTGTGVWLKWENDNVSARLGFEVDNGTTGLVKLRFDFNGSAVSNTNVANQYLLTDFTYSATQKALYLSGALDFSVAGASNATTCVGKIAIGNEPPASLPICGNNSIDPYPTTFDAAEIMIFNRSLTALEKNKVESYLAVKYGFTLDQSATYANNYTASDNSITWNHTANLPFIYNITGIGRDDGDSLIQRQSKSINTAGIITVFNGTYTGANFPAINVANTNNFTNNLSYLLFADNNLATTFGRCYAGTPVGFQRMSRVWKVQETNTIGTVTLAVKTTDVPTNTKHLLVSTDSAFTPANTTVYKLDNVNGYFTKSIVLPASSYFTYAGDSLLAHPTSNSPICIGTTLQLNSNLVGATAYQWTGPNGFTSTQLNPAVNPATANNTGIYTITGSASGCPFVPASISVTVTQQPAPPVITTPIVYCMGDSVGPLSNAVGQNLLWYSYPNGGTGSPVVPTPSTVLEDTLTWWVSQSMLGCESIRSKDQVYIHYVPSGFINVSRTEICQQDTISYSFFGNARSTAVYNWKLPLGYNKVLSGSGPGPYITEFDSVGTFNIRLQILDSGGCASAEILQPIHVKATPYLQMKTPTDACVDQSITTALNQISPLVQKYEWTFDGAKVIYGVDSVTNYGGPFGLSWNTAGQYVVSLTVLTQGCPSRTMTDTVNVHALPDARISSFPDQSFCIGDSVVLTAYRQDPNYIYAWSPKQMFNDTIRTKPSATAILNWNLPVILTVSNAFGCQDSSMATFNTKPCCSVYFPSAFSPNNDGKNDRFHVITVGHHQIDLIVVNRWGQVVFETKNEGDGWDGTFNGVPQPIGSYFYYIKYECSEGKFYEQKGDFLLVR